MEQPAPSLGSQIRARRRKLGLSLDDLAGRSGVSKPYLSLIENDKTNPPSDEKLGRIESSLNFEPGELLTQAHLLRTPPDIRAMIGIGTREEGRGTREPKGGPTTERGTTNPRSDAHSADDMDGANRTHGSLAAGPSRHGTAPSPLVPRPLSLDEAFRTGWLHRLVDRQAPNVDLLAMQSVPVINRVSAGYPSDFTDLSYPRGIADAYVPAPDLADPDAFAARVFGDSMMPRYRPGDVVIFSPRAPVRSGDDAFVRFDDGTTTFKRVYFEPESDGSVRLRIEPRNPAYPSRIAAESEIAGLYRALYRYEPLEDLPTPVEMRRDAG